MLDIDKIVSSILKAVNKPIKALADRLKHLEQTTYKVEEIVLDLMKYPGLLAAVEKRLDELPKPIALELLEAPKLPDIPKMISDQIDIVREEITNRLSDEGKLIGLVVEKLNSTMVPALDTLQKKMDADIEKFRDDIDEAVAKSLAVEVAALPKPKDGNSITVADVAPLLEELVAKRVAAIPPAKDGLGVSGALINREGHLVLTMMDGTAINLGQIVGKDWDLAAADALIAEKLANLPRAKDGVDGIGLSGALIGKDGNLVLTLTNGSMVDLGRVTGKDADITSIQKTISDLIAAIPKPKDGIDGEDGLGFEDLSVEYDGKRTFAFKFVRGDKTKEFSFKTPTMIYLGVFENGKKYEVGDTVTWGGSMWHCKKDTLAKPGEDNADWTLAAKRGRDAKPVVKRDQ